MITTSAPSTWLAAWAKSVTLRSTLYDLWPLKYEAASWLVVRIPLAPGEPVAPPKATAGLSPADYAEHVSLLGVAALFASTGRPGWRILAALTGAVWSYLGLVAIFSLPDQAGSWGILGGLAGLATGLVLVGAAALGEGEQRARVVGHLRPHHG